MDISVIHFTLLCSFSVGVPMFFFFFFVLCTVISDILCSVVYGRILERIFSSRA